IAEPTCPMSWQRGNRPLSQPSHGDYVLRKESSQPRSQSPGPKVQIPPSFPSSVAICNCASASSELLKRSDRVKPTCDAAPAGTSSPPVWSLNSKLGAAYQ